jgi:hypothetical protein
MNPHHKGCSIWACLRVFLIHERIWEFLFRELKKGRFVAKKCSVGAILDFLGSASILRYFVTAFCNVPNIQLDESGLLG